MGFETILKHNKTYQIVKEHFLNKEEHKRDWWIYDSGKKSPFYFMCPNCKANSTNINHLDTKNIDEKTINQITKLSETGSIYKIIKCSQCNTEYYVGIGYIEPNNGRDVYLLHSIIEIA
jgi:hypothetical protein